MISTVADPALDELEHTLAILAGMTSNKLLQESIAEMDKILNELEEGLALLPPAMREGLIARISRTRQLLSSFKGNTSDNSTQDNPLANGKVYTVKPPIHLKHFSLYPMTREILIDGVSHKIPQAEMNVLYALAESPGKSVTFTTSHSLLTRLSFLRRKFPILRSILQTMSKGTYMLHSEKK